MIIRNFTGNQKQAIKSVCSLWACTVKELKGITFERLLFDAERENGVTILWGLWKTEELKETI